MRNPAPHSKTALLDPTKMHLDESLLEPVLPPDSSLNGMAVSITPSGHIAMNQRLCEAVAQTAPTLRMDFSAYRDRTCILLRPTAAGSYKFPKGGRIKDLGFSRSLVEAGIPLPARYKVAWNEASKGWVGILETQIQSSAKQALAESLRSRKKSAGKEES